MQKISEPKVSVQPHHASTHNKIEVTESVRKQEPVAKKRTIPEVAASESFVKPSLQTVVRKQNPMNPEAPVKEKTRTAAQKEEEYQRVMTKNAVENANHRVEPQKTNASFEYDEKIGRIKITITDAESKEIIKEIPPEGVQKMLERIHTMRGMLMDEGF
ncbi:MAG: flagellar protein FlaG [Lachnospiraceae bacterium]|nr:flagellar protein FlaG [Lachnospiraceae bacterium]